ncbi:MAG: ferritin family protein [Deferribacteres bacterium]|nr:ferritin family protein [Deferribacteres bacterium]
MGFSTSEVVEMALQTERLGYEFYTAMSKRFEKDEKLRGLFEMLAFKEQAHEKIFADLKGKVKDERPEDWEEVSRYLRAIVESEFFLGKEKSLPPLEHVKSVAEAVNFALSFEKETLLYFYNLWDVVPEKEIINAIIKEEKEHVAWLREFRESMTGEG